MEILMQNAEVHYIILYMYGSIILADDGTVIF